MIPFRHRVYLKRDGRAPLKVHYQRPTGTESLERFAAGWPSSAEGTLSMTSRLKDALPSDGEMQVSGIGWSLVTWDDIQEWAGSRTVMSGRSYQRLGHVRDLVLMNDGRLTATVIGTEKYQVSVWQDAEKADGKLLQSRCTCPVGHTHCKHAVAVIAEHFESLADQRALPGGAGNRHAVERDEDDSGLNRIVPVAHGAPPPHGSPAEPPPAAAGAHPKTSSWDGSLKDNLQSKSHEELVDLVCSLMQRFSELRTDVHNRIGGSLPSN